MNVSGHEQFLRLFRANEPSVRAFIPTFVPDREAVSDVMQEVARAVLLDLRKPRGSSNCSTPPSWLTRW